MATPLLQLSDGTTTVTFANESDYASTDDYLVLPEGFRPQPPEPQYTFAPSPLRHGAPLTNLAYANSQQEIQLKIRGSSKPELERNAGKMRDLLQTAEEDAAAGRTPRVYLEYQITGGVTRVFWDVLAGQLDLPESALNTFRLNDNQFYGAALTLVCKPFCRGWERALAKAQSAIPRDVGIGIFGDATNLVANPVFYSGVAGGWSSFGAPDEFARYTNIKDSSGKNMPTCARLRADGASQGCQYIHTTSTTGTYTFSAYLRGRGVARLALTQTGGAGSANNDVTLTETWTRYEVSAAISGGGLSNVKGQIAYVSGTVVDAFLTKAQLEISAFATPFTPENEAWAVNQAGTGVIYQLAPGYVWTGTAHASTSTRSGVDAAGTTFQWPTTGLRPSDGFAFAAWFRPTSWAGDDGVSHYLLQIGAVGGADQIRIDKSAANNLALRVFDAWTTEKNISVAVTFAAEAWQHVVASAAADGTLALYHNGVAAVTAGGTGTGRVETMPATAYLGSDSNGANLLQGWIQVQGIYPHTLTAAQATALYDAGRVGNRLGYIEANNGAQFDGSNADANRGTQTFTNLNGRIRLRDVQGQIKAPVRIRVYNNTATGYGYAWLSHERYRGIVLAHIYDLTAAGSGVDTADVNALGDSYARIASMNTSSVQQIGTAAIVSDGEQRAYRVLLRASQVGSGVYFTATLYVGTVFPFYSKVLKSSTVSTDFYDLGVVRWPPDWARADSSLAASNTLSLYVGKASAGSEPINADYLVFLPVDQEVYWDDPRDGRWETDYEPYLAIDTRQDNLRIMNMTNDESTPGGYLAGIKGDVLGLLPGDSHLAVLGVGTAGWEWGNTWQIDTIRYAPRYLLPPGL